MAAMSEHRFWAIVNATLSRDGDPEAQLEALRAALEALGADDIAAFEKRFGELMERANTWDLWAAAYIIHGGCSDDAFDYFRHWLISRGRDLYETSVDNPDTLADGELATVEDACQFENFSYVAADVWHEKTGRDREDPESGFPFATPSGDDPEGEPFEEDEQHLSERLPKLWERYGDDPLG